VEEHIPTHSKLYHDVCGNKAPARCTPKLDFLGMDLAKHASAVHGKDLIPYVILIALVAGTAYLQQKQSMKKQTAVSQQMKTMAIIMPFMMVFFSYTVPAGLALYFLVGNILQIGQQELTYRTMPPPGSPPSPKTPVENDAPRGFAKLFRPTESTPEPPAPEVDKPTPPKPNPNQRRNKKRRR
jgi:YidC/Oxa1 family membrane protein insertase